MSTLSEWPRDCGPEWMTEPIRLQSSRSAGCLPLIDSKVGDHLSRAPTSDRDSLALRSRFGTICQTWITPIPPWTPRNC
jgi:hypothetical protein